MKISLFILISFLFVLACDSNTDHYYPENLLNYEANPTSPYDRKANSFADQGSWFSFAFSPPEKKILGFAGPFLMTQENGVWSSAVLNQLILLDRNRQTIIRVKFTQFAQKSFLSHLQQQFSSDDLGITQTLFFYSAHTALIKTEILNRSQNRKNLKISWVGSTFLQGLQFLKGEEGIEIISNKTNARGHLQFFGEENLLMSFSDSTYVIHLRDLDIGPGERKSYYTSQSYIFSEYNWPEEYKRLKKDHAQFQTLLKDRIDEKQAQLTRLFAQMRPKWQFPIYKDLMAKALLTMQNNWRIAAGELKHSGLFPSYHYLWFHGFWAWDSWKHAVALAHFDPDLAMDQIRALYDFQKENGFIADCVYRDTSIERHNYRNTKPPLSGWAIWEVYRQNHDMAFLKELYPKLVREHDWWYQNRDHDSDSLCEYGSTDGTLIAAKWESGMDNAVRFDQSILLKNHSGAYSLNQESVDLNCYLFSEKEYLAKISKELGKIEAGNQYLSQAKDLQHKIQTQFFDPQSNWFYDTSVNGKKFIKVKGSEGWIPLWTGAALPEQAQKVKINMMDPNKFFTHVPFQTLDASSAKFKPDGGYWRGPNWLDQAYFGIAGLKKYGFIDEAEQAADSLLHNASGLLQKGVSIRENYDPLTGQGLEAKNFSWSAAHIILLLIGI